MDKLLTQCISYAKSTLSDKNIAPKIMFGSGGELVGRDTFYCRELKIFAHKSDILNPEKSNKKAAPKPFYT